MEENINVYGWSRNVISEISKVFLREGQPYIVADLPQVNEIFLLFAKQTQLFESFLLLMQHNHTEEGIILFRSMINNSMLIQYLSTFDSVESEYRVKNFKAQPFKANLKRLNNYKFALEKGWFEQVTSIKNPMTVSDIEESIEKIKESLIEARLTTQKGKADTQLLTIRSLAEIDATLFSIYIQYYDIASRYEHSDVTSLDIYKEKIDDETPINKAYIMNLSRTDETLNEEILYMCVSFYGLSYLRILEFINSNEGIDLNLWWTFEQQSSLSKLSIEFDLFIHNNQGII